jgi:DNA-binding protein YbaB
MSDHRDLIAEFRLALQNARRRADLASLQTVKASIGSLTAAVRELEEQTFRATDPTGTVSVAVTGRGELSIVTISSHAIRAMTTIELGSACQDAIAAARQQCSECVAAQLMQLCGPTAREPESDGSGAVDSAGLIALLRDTAERIR